MAIPGHEVVSSVIPKSLEPIEVLLMRFHEGGQRTARAHTTVEFLIDWQQKLLSPDQAEVIAEFTRRAPAVLTDILRERRLGDPVDPADCVKLQSPHPRSSSSSKVS